MAPVLTKNQASDNDDSSKYSSKQTRPTKIANRFLTKLDDQEPRRKKKRASRWASEEQDKAFIPGMPTIMPSNLTEEQQKAYLTQLRIEEITRMLRTGELCIPSSLEDRSPSPEPVYDSQGKRLNTREVRTRAKLEGERHKLVLDMLKLNPEYKPPVDYKYLFTFFIKFFFKYNGVVDILS